MNIYRGRTHTEVYLASVLYESIEDRDIVAVKKLLLEKKADPNIVLPRKGVSCFHLVVGNDSLSFAVEVTSLIIQNGGNPNVQSDEGLTPVHIAAAWGRLQILKLLLYCGGDPQLTDNCYKTPLNYASDEGWEEAMHVIEDFISSQRQSIYQDVLTKKPCTIVLDKVLLNNGVLVGEYQLDEEEEDVSKVENNASIRMDLNRLPQTTSEEYVLCWCNNQELVCTSTDVEDYQAEQKYDIDIPIAERRNDLDSLKDSSVNTNYQEKEFTNFTSHSRDLSHRKSHRRKSTNITFRNKSKHAKNYISKDICKHKEFSRESGIMTLQDSSDGIDYSDDDQNSCDNSQLIEGLEKLEIKQEKDTSSDYCTCTDGSEVSNVLEKATYEFSSSKNFKTSKSHSIDDDQNSLISVTEVYKYIDPDEGVVLYEKRLLVSPMNSDQSDSFSSNNVSQISLPNSFDYDTDTLRKELTIQGFDPGPITKTTKRVYLRKLYQLKTFPQTTAFKSKTNTRVYSCELQSTLKADNLWQHVSRYQYLEDFIKKDFANSDPARKWRGGTAKMSFTYLLLDSRLTQNLPHRCDQLTNQQVWEIFLSAIFYVGKGTKSRPFAHLNEAINKYNKSEFISEDKKTFRILDMWKDNHGVICLHVFQNAISVESFTREAAIISALNLENITNRKGGEFYGCTTTWSQKQKKILGALLLYKAMRIFLIEGERQIFPCDVK